MKGQVNRDYYMAIFNIIPCITPRFPYQPKTLVSAQGLIRELRADIGVKG